MVRTMYHVLLDVDVLEGTLQCLESGDRVSLCHLGCSAVARSWLTAASTSWAQAILTPQPTVPGNTCVHHRQDFDMLPRLVLNSWAQAIHLPWTPKVLGLQVNVRLSVIDRNRIPILGIYDFLQHEVQRERAEEYMKKTYFHTDLQFEGELHEPPERVSGSPKNPQTVFREPLEQTKLLLS
ncbi:hypothetical protein AAY473_001303 [Plecturocebus cupreus]